MEFEWDPQKAAKNLRKHKVTFIQFNQSWFTDNFAA